VIQTLIADEIILAVVPQMRSQTEMLTPPSVPVGHANKPLRGYNHPFGRTMTGMYLLLQIMNKRVTVC